MKKKKERMSGIRQTRDGKKPIVVFGVTLGLILAAGTLVLLFLKLLSSSAMTSGREKAELQQDTFSILQEAIPEQQNVLPEPESEQKYASELADEEYRKKNHILAWKCNREDTVTISFIGDILLDDEYAVTANLLRRGTSIENGISRELLTQMRAADILVANNEFAFTNRGVPLEGKTYTFRADTGMVSYLHDMGVDVAVLANNHVFDYGETGLTDTLDTLAEAGIPYLGAGRNLEDASAPLYFIANDIKIALIAATQIERLDNPDTRGATENSAGTFRCWNPEKLYETIRKAKENSDFVIVYVHWGTENEPEPDWAQLEQAPGMAEAGADLIVGDHPHCLQGITYCGNTPVIYSLGNFWFNSKTVDTGILQASIGKEGLETLKFVPAIQSDSRTGQADEADKKRILSYLQSLSPNARIDSEGYITVH